MSDDLEQKLLKGTAYRIFFDELRKHLEQTKDIFEVDSLPPADRVYEACARFHTIKGGAGFFKLQELASTAGKLEEILNHPREELCLELGTLRGLVKELQRLALQVPEPHVQTPSC